MNKKKDSENSVDPYKELEEQMEEQIEEYKTDEDIIKNPQEGLKEGIETEEYDVKPNFSADEDELLELEGKEGIYVEYGFNGEDVKEGLKIFHKETIYKRNIIFTVLLLAIFGMYVYGIINNKDNLLSIFLACMCIGVVGFLWYVPLSHVRKTAVAADKSELRFNMTIYDSCVKIGEECGSFILHYNKEITKVFETARLFLICAGKERIFILPKRCLKDGETEQVKTLLSLVMDENYLKRF